MLFRSLANILFGSLRSKLRQTVAAARAHGAANTPVTGHPQARAELEARLALRSAREWEAMLEAWLALERSSRLGARVGHADFALFALTWRVVRARATTRARQGPSGSRA